jgi:hypothetical protein
MSSIFNTPPIHPVNHVVNDNFSGLEQLSNGPLAIVNNMTNLFDKTWKANMDNYAANPFIQICDKMLDMFASIGGSINNNPPNFFINLLDLNGMGNNSEFSQFNSVFNPSFFTHQDTILSGDLFNIITNQDSQNPLPFVDQFINDLRSAFTNAFTIGSPSQPGGFIGSVPQTFLPVDPQNLWNSMQPSESKKDWGGSDYYLLNMFYAAIIANYLLPENSTLPAQTNSINSCIAIFESGEWPLSNDTIQGFVNYFIDNLPTD